MEALDSGDQARVTRLIEWFADNQRIVTAQKLKKLHGTDDIWELRPTGQIRLLGFFLPLGNDFAISHGVRKKTDLLMGKEIRRAERVHAEVLAAHRRGDLE